MPFTKEKYGFWKTIKLQTTTIQHVFLPAQSVLTKDSYDGVEKGDKIILCILPCGPIWFRHANQLYPSYLPVTELDDPVLLVDVLGAFFNFLKKGVQIQRQQIAFKGQSNC